MCRSPFLVKLVFKSFLNKVVRRFLHNKKITKYLKIYFSLTEYFQLLVAALRTSLQKFCHLILLFNSELDLTSKKCIIYIQRILNCAECLDQMIIGHQIVLIYKCRPAKVYHKILPPPVIALSYFI